MEQLELDTAIAESNAKLRVFKEYDSIKGSGHSYIPLKRSKSRPKEESAAALLTSNAAAGGQESDVPGLLAQSSPDTQLNEPNGNRHTQVTSTEIDLV